MIIDNSWIEPYSPIFVKDFWGSYVKEIKYVCKYINEVNKQVLFDALHNNARINSQDEVQSF